MPVGQSVSSTSAVVDSVVELLYQLCTTQDAATKDRVNALLFWLHETGSAAVQVCIYGPSYVLFGCATDAAGAPRDHTWLHVPEDCVPIR